MVISTAQTLAAPSDGLDDAGPAEVETPALDGFTLFLDSLRATPLLTARQEIDLARPKENRGNSGFTDEERAGFDALLKAGFVDTFRAKEPSGGHYSWWTYRANARANNVGWRIDYCMASKVLQPRLKRAWIESQVMGSDHCPVGLELK